MPQYLKYLLLFLLLAAGVAISMAQEKSNETFRSDTRLVVLHASVIDNKGRLLTNLPQSAFKVFENNVEQPVKLFRREDVPVSMGLVVDNSGSMRNKRKAVESAALAAVKASNPRDEVTIVNFNDEYYRDVDFTSDIKKMEEALTRIDARGGTALRDSLSATIQYLKQKSKHDKKVILAITDGDDTASQLVTLEKLVQQAHDDEVLLFFIGLLSEEDKRSAKKAKRAMEALAKASGGTTAFPETTTEVEDIAVSMAQELRNQYVIAYSPINQTLDGSFRTIRVIANGPGRPTVRTRSGYYANPEAPKKTASTIRVPIPLALLPRLPLMSVAEPLPSLAH
jgi:Ca-activated chloride channel family protein